MIATIIINKFLRLILSGIGDWPVTMDGGRGGSSCFLTFLSLIPLQVPLPTSASMTTYSYSIIFWAPLTQRLSWDLELAMISDRPSPDQVSSVHFLATLSLFLFSHQGVTASQGVKLISKHKTLHCGSNTETVWPRTMSLSPGLMFPFHNCWSN